VGQSPGVQMSYFFGPHTHAASENANGHE